MKIVNFRAFSNLPNLLRPIYGYRCDESVCTRVELPLGSVEDFVSFSVCRMTCGNDGNGTLWPRPTGDIQISNNLVKIDPQAINSITLNFRVERSYWALAEGRFRQMQQRKLPKKWNISSGGKRLMVEVVAESDDMGEKVGNLLKWL